MAAKLKKDIDFNVEIGLKDGEEWSAEKLGQVKALAKELHSKRTPEQILKNQILGIQYRMEEYAEADEKRIAKPIPLEAFLHAYLNTLDISFRKFATSIGTNDANLKKYISGERKFNSDLARKFGHFFHTSPLTWMKVYQLNDLVKLRTERVGNRYDKYDFMKVVGLAATTGMAAGHAASIMISESDAVYGKAAAASSGRFSRSGVTSKGESVSRKVVSRKK